MMNINTKIDNQIEIRRCTRCIMDTTISEIVFDELGVCNFCHLYDEMNLQYPLTDDGERKLKDLVFAIKEDGKGKKYDCIIGLSGGTDSSYTMILLKQLGIRPLAVHFDNGWNTEISVSNIKNAIEKLGIDLITYVVDWEEFKDLQLSFLKASVPEVEVPTDLGIRAVLYKIAAEQKLKFIIEATSFRTEGVLPLSWGYKDGRYVKGIQKQFGSVPLKTYPNLPLLKYAYYTFVKRIKLVRLLNYFDYNKETAKEVLKKQLHWIDYGGHHFESHYTRFFQSYLAPNKFKMDRRMVTLSSQVNSGLINREEALRRFQEKPISAERIQEDKEYIAKKFRITLEEFERIINSAPRSFNEFPSYYPIIKRLRTLVRWASKHRMLPGFFQGGNFK